MTKPTTRTTRKPVANVLDVVPELASRALTGIRLHPQRGDVPGLADSKIGGTFLWPADEPWPTCSETCSYDEHPAASTPFPVLQLNTRDFPEVEFFPGTDLLQVLWCVYSHEAPIFAAKPFCYWRNSKAIKTTMKQMLGPKNEEEVRRLPKPCVLLPERVVEYPRCEDLKSEEGRKLMSWDLRVNRGRKEPEDISTIYDWELSACPSNKFGGYPAWAQSPEPQLCDCGKQMTLLLQLSHGEFDGGTWPRWMPEEVGSWEEYGRLSNEERELIDDAPNFGGGIFDGRQFIFICRSCKNWPIKVNFQS